MPKGKAKIGNSKVWAIARFVARFEMDDYRRKGALDYVRMFVAPGSQKPTESTQFLQQLAELEHYYPDQRDAYEGRFWRLCRLTATLGHRYRGYLLDAELRPLTAGKLAARLHLETGEMRRTLAALAKVGLVIRTEMPEFGNESENSETFGNVPENSEKSKIPSRRVKRNKKKKKKTLRVTPKATQNTARAQQTQDKRTQAPTARRTTPSPTTAPATRNPKESEAGQAAPNRGTHRTRSAPSVAPRRRRAGPQPLGGCLRLWWQDPACVAFGRDVVEALFGVTLPADNRDLGDELASEVGAFAKLFFLTPPPQRDALRQRAITKAIYVHRHGQRAASPGAVLTRILGARSPPSARQA